MCFFSINTFESGGRKMNKIYKKNEVTFAVIMIVIYVMGTVIAENITTIIGVQKLIPAIFHSIMSLVTTVWIIKHGYSKKYGLVFPTYNIAKVWFFIPLIFIACFGLIFGIGLQYSPVETVFFVISMVCVGFLEEIIFRGFLFTGISKTNVKEAIIISSLTFGIGHIVNLFNGKAIVATLCQIMFAIAVGFTLVVIFYKGKSLFPCIVFHSLNNSLSEFERPNEEVIERLPLSVEQFEMIYVFFAIVILLIYTTLINKKLDVTRG